MLQEAGLGGTVTVAEALELYASFWAEPRGVDDLLEVVALTSKRDARVGTLSGGQRRRLDLALALVGGPEVLFLDEPTTGLDPVARREAWQLVHELRGEGSAVLLTTHDMDEAEHLADRAIVMAHGRLVAEGTTRELAERLGAQAVITFRLPDDAGAGDLPPVAGRVDILDPVVEVRTSHPTQVLQTLTGWAAARDAELAALTVTRPRLEHVYFELTVTRDEVVA